VLPADEISKLAGRLERGDRSEHRLERRAAAFSTAASSMHEAK